MSRVPRNVRCFERRHIKTPSTYQQPLPQPRSDPNRRCLLKLLPWPQSTTPRRRATGHDGEVLLLGKEKELQCRPEQPITSPHSSTFLVLWLPGPPLLRRDVRALEDPAVGRGPRSLQSAEDLDRTGQVEPPSIHLRLFRREVPQRGNSSQDGVIDVTRLTSAKLSRCLSQGAKASSPAECLDAGLGLMIQSLSERPDTFQAGRQKIF